MPPWEPNRKKTGRRSAEMQPQEYKQPKSKTIVRERKRVHPSKLRMECKKEKRGGVRLFCCRSRVLSVYLSLFGHTLFRVWVCPISMSALEEMMDRQKLMRMTERSERMYLKKNTRKHWANTSEWCLLLAIIQPPCFE